MDNVDVLIFQKLSLEIKSRLYYESLALEEAFKLRVPIMVNSSGKYI